MALLIVLAVPLVASFISLVIPREKKRIIEYIAMGAAATELGGVAFIAWRILQLQPYAILQFLFVDPLSLILLGIIGVVGFAITMHSIGYLRQEVQKEIIGLRRVKQYFVLLHLFFFAMYLAVTANNPIVLWIAIETTTLSTAFLISFYNKASATEAAWKYLILNSVGLLLGFLGTFLFLGAADSAGANVGFAGWETLRSLAHSFNPTIVKIAFILVLIGYGTKAGLAPMHTWLPDAHSKAPAPISSLLSGVLLNVALYAILRFKILADGAIDPSFSRQMLLFFGILSISVATLIILIQKNYKRLLAYSSIEHMGIMTLGFAFGGFAVFAALLHMVYHALIKALLFCSAGNIFLAFSSTKIRKISGALSLVPATSIFFIGGILAIIGLPPFGLFFTEISILSVSIQQYWWISVILIGALLLVFIGFLYHLSHMMFGEPPQNAKKGEANIWTVAPLCILASLILLLSFWVPAIVQHILYLATAIITAH